MKTLVNRFSSIRGRPLLGVGLFFVGLMACLAIGVSTAQAQNYYVKDLGMIPEAKACDPAGMNNQGQVIGTANAGEYGYAFRYYYNGKEDEMERIGVLGSRAFGIDPSGIVVGDVFFSKMGWASHAALFYGEKVVDLGPLEGQLFSRANGINAMQYVVGYSGPARDSAQSRAFIWTATNGMMDMGTLGGDYAQAYAVNDIGWVTGTAQIPDMGIRPAQSHAFLHQPITKTKIHTKPMMDLGTLGGRLSCGVAVNLSNHVVGYSTIDGTDQINHAFFYDGKGMIDLGVLDRGSLVYQSKALAVNNSDQVVGFNYLTVGDPNHFNRVAFVWFRNDGQMKDLNSLIAGWADRYYLMSATAVNDHGQIAAHAYDYVDGTFKAVLLTPTK